MDVILMRPGLAFFLVLTASTAVFRLSTARCSDGFWGQNCGIQCGWCRENGPCDSNTGQCLAGCKDGWTGDNCLTSTKGSIPAVTPVNFRKSARSRSPLVMRRCYNGTWGPYCMRNCGHCLGNNSCEKDSGFCEPAGRCKPGWTGDRCQYRLFQAPNGTWLQPFCNVRCWRCDRSGKCIGRKRCKGGYYGDQCENICPNDKWGVDCRYNCPPLCNPPPSQTVMGKNVMRPCDIQTGWCMVGCSWMKDGRALGRDSDNLDLAEPHFLRYGPWFNIRCYCNGNMLLSYFHRADIPSNHTIRVNASNYGEPAKQSCERAGRPNG